VRGKNRRDLCRKRKPPSLGIHAPSSLFFVPGDGPCASAQSARRRAGSRKSPSPPRSCSLRRRSVSARRRRAGNLHGVSHTLSRRALLRRAVGVPLCRFLARAAPWLAQPWLVELSCIVSSVGLPSAPLLTQPGHQQVAAPAQAHCCWHRGLAPASTAWPHAALVSCQTLLPVGVAR
jgi:hypothetical protein